MKIVFLPCVEVICVGCYFKQPTLKELMKLKPVIVTYFLQKMRKNTYVDLTYDAYTWIGFGSNKATRVESLVKSYFKMKEVDETASSMFVKNIFSIKNTTVLAFIQYLGDEKAYKPRPHGNRSQRISKM